MFRVIEINGVASVVGVDWFALTGTARERSAQRASHAKLMESTHKMDVSEEDAALVGLVSADVTDFAGVTYSAAAWFAKAAAETEYSTVVLIKKLDKDNVWVCAATNGLPVVRGDRIVARVSLVNALDDVLGRAENTQLLIDASNDDAEAIAAELAIFGACGSITIEDYLGDIEPVAKVVKLGASGVSKILMAGAVLIFAIVTVGYWMYSSNEAERQRLADLASQAQQSVSPDEMFMVQFKKYFSAQPRYGARTVLLSMWNEVRGFQLLESGWEFEYFECVSAKAICKAEYARTPFAGDIQFDTQRFVAVSKQIDSASAIQNIEPLPISLPAPITASALLARYNHDAITEKALPLLRSASDVSLKANFGKESPVSAIVAPGASLQLVEGHWSLSGDMALFDMIKSLPDDFMLDVARIERTEHGVEFRVEGSFWIALKSAPASNALSANP